MSEVTSTESLVNYSDFSMSMNQTLLNIQSTDFEDTFNSNNTRRLFGINQQHKGGIQKIKNKKKPKNKIKKLKLANLNREDANPSQVLNEAKPGLQFTFELDNTNVLEVRYVCKVSLDGIIYEASGTSKKEAKRNCSDKVLSALYPDVYKKKIDTDEQMCLKKKIDRIPKILNINSIKTKTAAQLLNELDPVLARGGRYTNETVVNNERIFTFEIELPINKKIVRGTGKNKKIAKNEASKLVIKELYNIDIDLVLSKSSDTAVGGVKQPQPVPPPAPEIINDLQKQDSDDKFFFS